MDQREIQLLNTILQVKSMMHMHGRVITFINNIFVCGKFQALISQHIIPSLMTLLMFNVTNHIKSRKQQRAGVSKSARKRVRGSAEGEEDPVTTEGSPFDLDPFLFTSLSLQRPRMPLPTMRWIPSMMTIFTMSLLRQPATS